MDIELLYQPVNSSELKKITRKYQLIGKIHLLLIFSYDKTVEIYSRKGDW